MPQRNQPRTRKKRSGCLRAIIGLLKFVFVLFLLVVLATAGPNVLMYAQNAGDIKTANQMEAEATTFDADAILVLGASVRPNGTPSPILADRLDTAIELYKGGVAPKIIMSGDNSDGHYNEVMNMCNYAVDHGVKRSDIFCDHAGVNTYDSMYRAKFVFGAKRLVVVTNEYHLYRAMFLSKTHDIETRGVASDKGAYTDMDAYEEREFYARIKDFYATLLNVEPSTYSEPVSLDQSGTVTQWWKKRS